jgi:hypothetical protein
MKLHHHTAPSVSSSTAHGFTHRPVRIHVPDCATIARILIAGAAGGAIGSEPGAEGMCVGGTLAVRPGQSIQLFVGGQGGATPGVDEHRATAAGGWSAPGFRGEPCLLHAECWAGGGGGATIMRRDGILIAVAEGGAGAGACGGPGGGSGRPRTAGLWDTVVQPAPSTGDGFASIRFEGPLDHPPYA